MINDLPELEVFYGDLTANRAYVYARLARPVDDTGLKLTGHVRGPRCLYAQTLPSTAPLIDLGAGPTMLARAAMMEPCFWSPDLPEIYDVMVRLQRGSEILGSSHREIGLRSLGVRDTHFTLDGKRWIIRGVRSQSTTEKLPRAWHDEAASYVISSVDEEALSEASQWGTLSIVEVSGTPGELMRQLQQLALHPSAALAIIDGQLPSDFKISAVAPNLLLVQPCLKTTEFIVEPWASAVWIDANDARSFSEMVSTLNLPVLAARPLESPLPIAQARAACDELQRDIAPIGQFAGYIV
jgi:hypothetical protein